MTNRKVNITNFHHPRRCPPGKTVEDRALAAVAVIVAALGIAACSAVDTASHDSTDDRQLAWEFEKLWEVDAGTSDFLAEPALTDWAIATDAADNIYVRDREAMAIHVISQHGELIRSLGRSGDGPGEFCNPESLDVAPDGTLTVMDKCAPGFLRWDVATHLYDSQTRAEATLSFEGRVRVLTTDSVLVTQRERSEDADGVINYARHFAMWTPGGTTRLRAGLPSPRRSFASPCGAQVFLYPVFFERAMAWDERDGVLAIASDSSYVVDLFVDLRAAGRVARRVEARPISPTLVRRHVDGMPGWKEALDRWEGCGVPRAEAIERIGYADMLQAIADVRVGPGQEVWVRRSHISDEMPMIDVIALTGGYLGTVPEGSPFPAAFLSEGRIVATGEGDFGATLTAYRVVRED